MSNRAREHIAAMPLDGDVFEIAEQGEDHEQMVRVICFREDFVGIKIYGLPNGRQWMHISRWREWLSKARLFKIVRAGDQDLPF